MDDFHSPSFWLGAHMTLLVVILGLTPLAGWVMLLSALPSLLCLWANWQPARSGRSTQSTPPKKWTSGGWRETSRTPQIVGRAGASAAPCTVCGKPEDKHGSYPTCSGHPYTSTFECGAVGVYSASKGFVGLPCPGAACRNGCVVAARQAALHPQARGASTVSPARTVDGQMNKETPHD